MPCVEVRVSRVTDGSWTEWFTRQQRELWALAAEIWASSFLDTATPEQLDAYARLMGRKP